MGENHDRKSNHSQTTGVSAQKRIQFLIFTFELRERNQRYFDKDRPKIDQNRPKSSEFLFLQEIFFLQGRTLSVLFILLCVSTSRTQMDEEDVLDNFETLCQTTLINPRLSTAIQRVPSVMRQESHHNFDIRSRSGSAKTIGSVGSHHLPRNSHKNVQMEEEDVLDGLGNYTSNTSFFAYPNLIPREKVSTRKSRVSTSISRESAAALFMEEETGFGTKKTIKVNNRRQSILPQATKAKRVSKQVAKQSEKNENTNSHFSHRKKSSTENL